MTCYRLLIFVLSPGKNDKLASRARDCKNLRLLDSTLLIYDRQLSAESGKDIGNVSIASSKHSYPAFPIAVR
jgi:hypothetical protein